jgi:drug/metabolite transporter (DMT)-like permease
MSTTKKPALGVLMALGASLLFGLNASTTKVIIDAGITPEQVVLFRCFASAMLAGFVVLFTDPGALRVKKSEWKSILAFGVIGVALMQWAYSNAVSNLPIGIALLIEYTAIVIVPIASIWLFRERISRQTWTGAALVIFGLLVVSNLWQGGLNLKGLAYAFTAAVCLSVYFIMGEHGQKNRSAMSLLFYSMLVASSFWLIASPWWHFDAARLVEPVNLTGTLTGVSVPGWALMLWLGTMGSFSPMLLTYASLRHLSATAVGIASTAETVFAFIFAWVWLGQEVSSLQLLGGLLVISGIVLAQTSRRKSWRLSN